MITPRGQQHAQQVAAALWGTSGSGWFYKHVMVVEEDIDVHDPEALDWAMAYRVNAGLGDITLLWPDPRLTAGSVDTTGEGEHGQVRQRRMDPGAH